MEPTATQEFEIIDQDEQEEAQPFIEDDVKDILSPEELQRAREQGLIISKEENTDIKQDNTENKKSEIDKDTKAIDQDITAYEMMDNPDKEKEGLAKYNRNEKALYFEMKDNRKRRQSAENERDLLKIKLSEAERKLKEQEEPPKEEQGTDDDATDFVTKADLRRSEEAREKKIKADNDKRAAVTRRLNEQEAEYKGTHPDFDEIVGYADRFMKEDETGLFATQLTLMAADETKNAAEYVYQLGLKAKRLYGEGSDRKKEKKGTDENIHKMVTNANKRRTSASLGGGMSGSRIVSEDDLTVEDVSKMAQEQYNRLSPKTRERILRGG